jgi:hypothetical protein
MPVKMSTIWQIMREAKTNLVKNGTYLIHSDIDGKLPYCILKMFNN